MMRPPGHPRRHRAAFRNAAVHHNRCAAFVKTDGTGTASDLPQAWLRPSGKPVWSDASAQADPCRICLMPLTIAPRSIPSRSVFIVSADRPLVNMQLGLRLLRKHPLANPFDSCYNPHVHKAMTEQSNAVEPSESVRSVRGRRGSRANTLWSRPPKAHGSVGGAGRARYSACEGGGHPSPKQRWYHEPLLSSSVPVWGTGAFHFFLPTGGETPPQE